MQIVDPVVLDAADFLPDGAELDLSGAGFRVLDANFGEADVELELQRQAIGEVPTTYHPPNTTTVLALGVRAEGEVDLPTAAHQLAQKVGEINTPGTEHWLKREFEVGGDFAGALGKRVYKATLSGLGTWQRGESPDVVLTLVTGPYWYATEEIESKVFTSEAGTRELIWELLEVLGTASGLIRIRVTNEGGEHWRGLISAPESRDHPQNETANTTAAPAYEAQTLTLRGGATKAEREGVKVVRHSSLTAGWLTILSSEIAGVGHMTHKGVRRMRFRIYDPGEEAGGVQLRLRWRSLGSPRWSENSIVPTPIVDAFQIIDCGESRPEVAALGDQSWEWELQVRAPSGAGAIDIARVWPGSAEQMLVVSAPDVSQGADTQSSKSPGTVENSSTSGLVAWSNPSNAKASDNARATAAIGGPGKETSQILVATNFGHTIPEAATVVGLILMVERSSVSGKHKDLSVKIEGGSSSFKLPDLALPELWPAEDAFQVYGASNYLWGQEWQPTQINEKLKVKIQAQAVETGTAGIDSLKVIAYYTEAGDENRMCFAGRSIELRSDGVFRQHAEDNVWGELTPEGFLPSAAASGMEKRTMRGIIIPTEGDLDQLPDDGPSELSVQVLYRPAYLFAREAA